MTTKELLSAADQLPGDQLHAFAEQVMHLAAVRRCPSLPDREAELLRRIGVEPDRQRVQQYRELLSRRESGSLAAAETSEMLALSDWLEESHAQRLEAVAELAQLRGLPLAEMMKQLGISHLITEPK